MSAAELQTIPLRAVERTLRQIWHESVDADGGVVQVRTLNLLVFVPAREFTSDIQNVIDDVSIMHPGRTLTLIASDEAEPTHAQIKLACRLGDGGKQICGEQIMLRSGDGGAPLPSAATSLLLPALPVFIWWIGDPDVDDPIFDALITPADRVIVDSRTWRTPHATLRAFAQIVRQSSRQAFTDLLWTALTPWRGVIAQCFDLPDSQRQLEQLDHITIAHGPTEHDRLEALLLLGWLGSRLGWRVADQPAPQLLHADGSAIDIVLQTHQQHGLDTVVLQSPTASFRFVQRSQASCIDMQIALRSASPLLRVVHLKPQSLVDLVGEEVMVLEHDQGYEAALQFAAELSHLYDNWRPD